MPNPLGTNLIGYARRLHNTSREWDYRRMSPTTEQLIRDYLNRVSVAALGRLGSPERRALLARTRESIERELGTSAAPAAEVARVLAALGEPEALVDREGGRAAATSATGPVRMRPAASQPARLPPDDGPQAQPPRFDGAADPGAEPGSAGVPGSVPGTREFTAQGRPVLARRRPGEPGLAGSQNQLRRLWNRAGAGGQRDSRRASNNDHGLPVFAELAARARKPAPAVSGPAGQAAANGQASPKLAPSPGAAGLSGSSAEADAPPGAGAVSRGSALRGAPPPGAAGRGRRLTAALGNAAWPSRWSGGSGRKPESGGPAAGPGGGSAEAAPASEAPVGAVAGGVASALGRAAGAAWVIARRHPLEACALLLLGPGGLAFPPIWLFGVLVALPSKIWDFRDKWVGLAGPVVLVIVGAWLAVTLGGKHGSVGAYAYEAWLVAGYLSRAAAVLGAAYLAWRLHHGRRQPAEPPWNRHRLG
jgi:ribosomal protein L34